MHCACLICSYVLSSPSLCVLIFYLHQQFIQWKTVGEEELRGRRNGGLLSLLTLVYHLLTAAKSRGTGNNSIGKCSATSSEAPSPHPRLHHCPSHGLAISSHKMKSSDPPGPYPGLFETMSHFEFGGSCMDLLRGSGA